jgi:hypothetical protein
MGAPQYPPPRRGQPPAGNPPPGYPPHPPPGYPRPQGWVRPPGQPPDEGFWGRQVRVGLDRQARQFRLFKYVWPFFVLLVICGIGAVILNRQLGDDGRTSGDTGAPAPATPRAAATSFLGHLIRDKPDAAYEYLCASTQARYDRAAFASYVKAHEIDSFSAPGRGTPSSVPRQQQSAASGAAPEVSTEYFQLNYASGAKEVHAFTIVRDPGGYRVCGDPY